MGMTAIAARLPEWARAPLKRLKDSVTAIPYYGSGRFCPVCGRSSRRFRPFGVVPREDAQCAHCGSLERHRLLWLYVQTRTDLFDGRPKKVLHVAPEPCLKPRLRRRLGDGYTTADLFDPTAMVRMDIMDIHYPDQHFDVIYCSHVLEHVEDDRKAMREFHRVLRSDGWAILLVPITARETFEDPSITTPEERLKTFGQEDHVRRYGPDYADRLRDAGFRVEVTRAADLVPGDEMLRMRLTTATTGEIYFCTKE
jgi:SAM-dependent methyltransferase